jgi:peptidoglycan/LPS O-acetylase OafA/YrhL
LLRRRFTLFLGHISYSVYLTHGIVLYFVVQLALGPKEVIRMGPTQYWAFIAFVVGPLVVLSSTLTYRFIEAPFLSLASLRHKRARKKEAPASETVVGPTLVAEA